MLLEGDTEDRDRHTEGQRDSFSQGVYMPEESSLGLCTAFHLAVSTKSSVKISLPFKLLFSALRSNLQD